MLNSYKHVVRYKKKSFFFLSHTVTAYIIYKYLNVNAIKMAVFKVEFKNEFFKLCKFVKEQFVEY